jgi:hypothetical protein
MMIQLIKKLFLNDSKIELIPDPPGRTFKRILTGDYFSHKDRNTDKNLQLHAKEKKINQIKELKLFPKHIKYTYKKGIIFSAFVSFQKEELSSKWNMLHITEISFIVYADEFKIFESMANVKLENDFRDVTLKDTYTDKERREESRGLAI